MAKGVVVHHLTRPTLPTFNWDTLDGCRLFLVKGLRTGLSDEVCIKLDSEVLYVSPKNGIMYSSVDYIKNDYQFVRYLTEGESIVIHGADD